MQDEHLYEERLIIGHRFGVEIRIGREDPAQFWPVEDVLPNAR